MYRSYKLEIIDGRRVWVGVNPWEEGASSWDIDHQEEDLYEVQDTVDSGYDDRDQT